MKRAPNQPETVSLTIYAGIYIAYTVSRTPTRCYPNMATIRTYRLLQGRVRLWREGDDDGPTEYCAPATIRIPAHIMHRS